MAWDIQSLYGIDCICICLLDSQDPASAIPKGTLLSLLISMISYVLFVFFSGGSAFREASGNITELVNGSMIGVTPSCMDDHVSED